MGKDGDERTKSKINVEEVQKLIFVNELDNSLLREIIEVLSWEDNFQNFKELLRENENIFHATDHHSYGCNEKNIYKFLIKLNVPIGNLIKILAGANFQKLLEVFLADEPLTISQDISCTELNLYPGQSLILECLATGIPFPTYQWFHQGKPLERFTSSELNIHEIRIHEAGSYYCMVKNINRGNKQSNILYSKTCKVNVNRPPNSDISILRQPISPENDNLTYNEDITLSCEIISLYPVQYKWLKNGSVIKNSSAPTLNLANRNDSDEVETSIFKCVINNTYTSVLSSEVVLKFLPKVKHYAEDKVALLIGNQKYTYEHFSDLPVTVYDVETLANILKNMNFKVISLMNLNHCEMKRAIEIFLDYLDRGVYGLFYFAGHGFQKNKECIMMPTDASGTYSINECYNVEDLVEKMLQKNPALAYLMIDTCLRETFETDEELNKRIETRFGSNPREPKLHQNLIYFYSSVWNSSSFEMPNSKNGFYMTHVKKHLPRNKSLWDVHMDVKEEFSKYADSRYQVPMTNSTLAQRLSLRDAIVGEGPAHEDRMEMWNNLNDLPDDNLINLEKINLNLKICMESFMGVFQNSLTIKFILKSNEICDNGISNFELRPQFLHNKRVLEIEKKFNFCDATLECIVHLFDIQRFQNKIHGNIAVYEKMNLSEEAEFKTSIRFCIPRVLTMKYHFWRNLDLGDNNNEEQRSFINA